MKRRLLLLWLLAGVAVFVSGDRLGACVCIAAPACTSVADADAIFIGHVIEVEPRGSRFRSARADDGPHARVRVRVQETFVGDAGGEVDLVPAGTALTDCYARFQAGETYLVFAGKDPVRGEFVVGACGGSRLLAHVPLEDLAYFRSLPVVPPETGSIAGRALLYDSDRSEPDTVVPVPGVVVVGQSENSTVTATTDANGRYHIEAPPGRYRFSAAAPDGLQVRGREATWIVNLRDSRGCGVADVPLAINGRIAGRLVTADGTPIPHMTVVAFRSGAGDSLDSEDGDATDTDGNFEIAGLLPGNYAVGLEPHRVLAGHELRLVPRVFLPGTLEADGMRRVSLARGARVDVGTFTLPAGLATVTIAGIVRDSQNTPVPEAFISVFEAATDARALLATTGTDRAGTFRAAVLARERYVVHVLSPGVSFAEVTVPPFQVTGEIHGLDVVLPRTGDRTITPP